MPGTSVAKKHEQRRRRQAAHALVSHKQRLVAEAVPIEELPDEDPADVMQLLINRVAFLVRSAAAEVDRLTPGLAKNQSHSELEHELWSSWDEQGNRIVMANYWVEHEAKLRAELRSLSEKAQALGLGERRTRVQEAQMQLLGQALKNACVKAGLADGVQRRLGSALRDELAVLEGTTSEA